jgi:hypothetical protein
MQFQLTQVLCKYLHLQLPIKLGNERRNMSRLR